MWSAGERIDVQEIGEAFSGRLDVLHLLKGGIDIDSTPQLQVLEVVLHGAHDHPWRREPEGQEGDGEIDGRELHDTRPRHRAMEPGALNGGMVPEVSPLMSGIRDPD